LIIWDEKGVSFRIMPCGMNKGYGLPVPESKSGMTPPSLYTPARKKD
jgi:hypothetical protein